jgi:ribosomal peptide maturation radical SAM protein 1
MEALNAGLMSDRFFSDDSLDEGEKDVLFAYMPYHRLTHPALGASILKSCLEEQGISSRVAYFGLDFAEKIGASLYNSLLNSRTPLLQAEWTFVQAAFGHHFPDERAQEVGRYYPWATKDIRRVAESAEKWIQDVVNLIAKNPPRILVCSSMFQQNLASLAVLRGVKERCSHVVTIMGGPNTEGILGIGLLRRAPWLDYVCTGEGEETFPLLCKNLLHNSHQNNLLPIGVYGQSDLARFEGLFNADIPRATLSNMNKSPAPSFDDYFKALQETSIAIDPGLLLESSRGCWWGQRSHCTFCGLNGDGMAYRAREPQAMADIVKQTTSKYSTDKIEFVDNIIAKSYFDDFLPLLKDESLTLFYETKADVSESDVKSFRESGVYFIQPGIESLSDPVLKLMRKGTSTALNLECLRLCREYGINPAWSILSGFPGEQDEWYEETLLLLPKLFHLRPPNGFIPIRYDRFSPYHDRPEAWGLTLEPFEAYQHLYPAYCNQHDDIAYFFKKSGRDEVVDDGLSVWSETHWACRRTVAAWKEFWSDRQKNGEPQPELYLYKDTSWKIRDDRRPAHAPIEHIISIEMATLLMLCRERKSLGVLKRHLESKLQAIISDEQLSDLINQAIQHDWIIQVSQQLITIVQIYNHQQLPSSAWPGGRLVNASPEERQSEVKINNKHKGQTLIRA